MPAVLDEPEILILEPPPQVKPGGPGGGGPRDFEPGGSGGGGGDDDERRREDPDYGLSAGMIGMIAVIVSVTALFATIVIAYMVRSRTRSHWEAVPLPSFLWVSTVLLLASSFTLERARRAFARFQANSYAQWLMATFFLGLGFILSQALVLRDLVSRGVYLQNNPHSSLFYVITGAHGVHLMGGMLALFFLIWRAAVPAGDASQDFRTQRNLIGVAAVYWHFLDVLWVGLFLMLLFWR